MQVEWYGQSAFRLTDGGTTVFIDPFDDLSPVRGRGMRWDYPAIADVDADLVLITHEHLDHNGIAAIAGDPVTLRSTAGRLDSPIGEVLAVAAEHDDAAMRSVRYQDIVPAQRIVYTYDMLLDETRISVSVATVQFRPDGDGTRLVVAEQGAFLRRPQPVPWRGPRPRQATRSAVAA